MHEVSALDEHAVRFGELRTPYGTLSLPRSTERVRSPTAAGIVKVAIRSQIAYLFLEISRNT